MIPVWNSSSAREGSALDRLHVSVFENRFPSARAQLWSHRIGQPIQWILYVLLAGYPPFWDPRNRERVIEAKIKRAEYEFDEPAWKDISPSAKELISQLMTLDVEKRLTAEEWPRGAEYYRDPRPHPCYIGALKITSTATTARARPSGSATTPRPWTVRVSGVQPPPQF